ncbi:MAG: hypothetical protein AB8B99_16630 [Phormidesmis sp.]
MLRNVPMSVAVADRLEHRKEDRKKKKTVKRRSSKRKSEVSMRALIKSPYKSALLACCCWLSAETLLASPVRAGSTPVVLPASSSTGLGDTFVEPGGTTTREADPLSSAPIETLIDSGIFDALDRISATGEVETFSTQPLNISPEQFDSVLLAAAGTAPASALRDLERQLANETGLTIEIARLNGSARNLEAAIASLNQMLQTLDGAQLQRVANSPTFMILRELLESANDAILREDRSLTLVEESAFELLRMSLVEDVVIEAEPTPTVSQPATPVAPAVGVPSGAQPSEPIRGLW